jgi:hypothetical protein
MPAIRTVSNIKANLLRPALTSHFEVELGIPDPLRSWLGQSQDKLNLMCSEAVLPGSQLATIEILNDYQGVTERHAYRRQFDQSIDLTFYVDAEKYIPIKFFEKWISLAMNEQSDSEMASEYYSYRAAYPTTYTATGLTVRKFERDHKSQIEYEFVKSFPLAITSMPVSYEASSLLKCSVQMTYIRYVLKGNQSPLSPGGGIYNPFQQSQFNAAGFLSGAAANLAGSAVNKLTGSAALGNIGAGLAGRAVRNLF